VTIKTLRTLASSGTPFPCLTCYDATTARWLQRAGIPLLLVGDTAAEVVLGFSRTIDMPLEVLLALTAGVKRGAPNCYVMGDMPFMSYHASPDEGVRNAGRFLTEGLADCVKLEADETFAPLVDRLTRAGVPVCAHVGSRPQRAALTGGYAGAGRTPDEAAAILRDARALQDAGAVLLLIEAVPDALGDEVTRAARVPVIGIGAGPAPHGQVIVLQDLLGLSDRPPPFSAPEAAMGEELIRVARAWAGRVGERRVAERR
jgi:3-methyl-2-oxobutanoate hydroxymethyltransferase